ncbi:MAG: TetR-like C-terminal domain-containing protein [Clostridiales bacterium]|nr:TetR family transcriptional regulator C-terminal domain-containing protein [Roseburia sp.]MDD7635450.1 TetR-like C-terminal domain-containing protein [Clostridiales bacterium]MDY4111772.1 TetR-like C-terminal domain-containing protein [Roseburia sp.]
MATASLQQIKKTEQKTDRRVRRTKALLSEALFSLLESKNYQDISVKELCEAADVNRGTFYLHYKDIYDMVEQIEQDILSQFEELISKHAPVSLNANPNPLIYDIFQFAMDNRTLYTSLLGPNGDISFLLKIKKLFRERLMELYASTFPQEELTRFEYFYHFAASGCIGLIEHWLQSETPKSPEEMAALANDIITIGIRSLT